MSDQTNSELAKFKDELYKCTKCGWCTFWCPVYQEDPVESSVARGKLSALKEVMEGKQEYTPELAEALGRCTLCGTCSSHCASKTNNATVLLAARADKVKAKGIPFPFNIAYRYVLPHRVLFGNLIRIASWFQGIFMPKTEGTIRHLPFFLSALGEGRQIPSIAPKFLRQSVPVVNKPPKGVETKIRVGYFTGCMTDYVFVDVGKHVIDFLTRNGVEVIVPREQGCCGAAVYIGAGDFDTGKKMADGNIKAFANLDVDYIIGNCATCVSALKDYNKFLADTPERKETYEKFAAKLKDITEFVVDVLKPPASVYKAAPAVRGKKVTWHDPCHLNRHLNIREQPRFILNSIPDIEFVEMTRPDWCCGMAGAFSMYHYDLSKKIATKKMETIKDTNADILVTDCPGCMIQFIDNTIRHKIPIKVMHIMELLE